MKLNLFYKKKLVFYLEELFKLKKLGNSLKSFTIDSKKGLIISLQTHFNATQIQLWHFYQVQIVTKHTTKKSKTECEKGLGKLILNLKNLPKKEFIILDTGE